MEFIGLGLGVLSLVFGDVAFRWTAGLSKRTDNLVAVLHKETVESIEGEDARAKELIREMKEGTQQLIKESSEKTQQLIEDGNKRAEESRKEFLENMERGRQEFRATMERSRQEFLESMERSRQEFRELLNRMDLRWAEKSGYIVKEK